MDDYKLYQAALEWDLIDPIVIEKREDIKSEYRWKDRVNPYHHQVTNLITFCRRLPVTLLADDVGLGKTISAGLIISELISRGRLSKILIVCPKILREQWKEELLTKFDIPSIIVTGRELISTKPPSDAGAVITTYNSARLYLDKIAPIGYEMLILDEAHKLRNLYGVEQTPQVALCFRKALADHLFKYVLMLTATPIQNRLWDIYSLVDILTVARGHENPFGSQGIFSRKFIADHPKQARQLRQDARDEFRSIVYSYMSRIRRGDANLHFPNRVVNNHAVDPTPEELELIAAVAKSIEKLNFFSQIIILQAIVSSPEALVKMLNGMVVKGTAPESLAKEVKEIAKRIPITAKLNGVATLIEKIKSENPINWRLVIFTRWRETQTSIQNFLEKQGISCGLINGDSALRNQETINKFKKDQPEINVIISTEAGSEGINLQCSNILVNYDLPWNPMVVEQRIGRIQRLASDYANVCIFNIILKKTFDEYIVGRLMEKLQMASHAIGDVEALLSATGIDEGEENGSASFEEKIRQLVVASLVGKDIELAAKKAEESIKDAKIELAREEKNINSLLGRMDGSYEEGPKCPKLPDIVHSMDAKSFVLSALENLGAEITPQKSGAYLCKLSGKKELIVFDNNLPKSELNSTLYLPGTPAFGRLVSQIASKDLHYVVDEDNDIQNVVEKLSQEWVGGFGGKFKKFKIEETFRCFDGVALVRIRATVACDSYERLVEMKCSPDNHRHNLGRQGVEPVDDLLIENPSYIGININLLEENAKLDSGIQEFCHFYIERLNQEVKATGNDERKRKKIEDDFTPRLEISLVGVSGTVNREFKTQTLYNFENGTDYASSIIINPSKNKIVEMPEMGKCFITGRTVPRDCLGKCDISRNYALQHLLINSEFSERRAIPQYVVNCELSGKKALEDEVERSGVTGKMVAKSLLKISDLSGKKAEPQFFVECDFTKSEVLEAEIAISQISGKRYRIDEELCSSVSGKKGHKQEFIFCSQTNQPLLSSEAEKCEVTGKIVVPGILEECEVSGKKVLPSELEKCIVTGKKALRRFFVSSSISGARILEKEAIKSISGDFCAPVESKACIWSGRKCHPNDLRACNLTGESIHFEYAVIRDGKPCLEALAQLLDGTRKKADKPEVWDDIIKNTSEAIGNNHNEVEAAELSLNGKIMAVSLEVRSWLGLKIRQSGILYSVIDNSPVGKISTGKREENNWTKD